MIAIRRLLVLFTALTIFSNTNAQSIVKGRVIDSITREPVQGASIKCLDKDCEAGCMTGSSGEFELKCAHCNSISISYVGYQPLTVNSTEVHLIVLTPSSSLMNEIVVTANRGEHTRRSLAPVAVTSISSKLIQDTRAISADQLLNKISGVNTVSLGNEQHQMSIRQPITTKSLFLYLEDGIPVRTTGIFNHNALLEMNMAATKTIEVIKGPSSSLYGSEAIGGVVNFITISPTQIPVAKLSLQGNTIGYKRAEMQTSFSKNKWGFALSGYYAGKRNGFLEYSDFDKSAITARIDHRFNDRTHITNSATWVKYHSDMAGTIDSAMFNDRQFINLQTFTYRKVDALRIRSTLTQEWNQDSKTILSLVYRDNLIGQNPAYRIKDDHRKVNGNWTGRKDLAHGEINNNSFNSYALIAQHRQNFGWKNASITTGASLDLSPSGYQASYIRITKDTITKKYTSYQATDSSLSRYNTHINNYAAFGNFEFSPAEKLRVVASLRYDVFQYDFNNKLAPSSFSGSPDTSNIFRKWSSKIGFTYNISRTFGFYANYSQGFVPPQLTEMYTGVKVPELKPAVFYNYEIGGWASIIPNRLSFDASIYSLKGTNEVVSVKMDDGSTENRNAGSTSHQGIEFSFNTMPVKDLSIRFSGAYSQHRFKSFIEKGNDYSSNEMNGAPRWIHNIEAWYKPSFAKGLRIGAEWQKLGAYFMDPSNTAKYKGYDLLNLRIGYQFHELDLWMNVLNATDNYYSNLTTRTASSQTYQLADPRNFQLGIFYDLSGLFKK